MHIELENVKRKKNVQINTSSIPDYKSFWLFWYIYFVMYLDIHYISTYIAKWMYKKKVKATYNLEWRE